jgi:hypothetical protein
LALAVKKESANESEVAVKKEAEELNETAK